MIGGLDVEEQSLERVGETQLELHCHNEYQRHEYDVTNYYRGTEKDTQSLLLTTIILLYELSVESVA